MLVLVCWLSDSKRSWGSRCKLLIRPVQADRLAYLLSAAIKKAQESEDVTKKITEMGLLSRYLDVAQSNGLWGEVEGQVGPLIPLLSQQ